MYSYPNEQGRFGDFGGKFVPETLMQPLEEIEKAFLELKFDNPFETRGRLSVQETLFRFLPKAA